MKSVLNYLDEINEKAGKLFSWSTSLMVWLICIDVVMRYCFNFTLIWIIELETYFFALSFLMASGYAFKHNKHVRVDVFYCKYSDKKKARIDFLGGLFLLLPWSLISSYVCFNYFLKSWKIGESSFQPGGLPALYILKFILFLGFLLLLIQALVSIAQSFIKMREVSSSNSVVSNQENS